MTSTARLKASKQSSETATVLVDAVQRLSLVQDREAIQDIVRRAARRMTGADGATFVLRDGDKCFYVDEDAIEPLWKGQRFPLETCISGWSMLNRRATAIPDIYADPRIPHDAYRPTFVKSLAMVPIRSVDPIGAIGNYWAEPHEATAAELAALQSLADATAVSLENVALVERVAQDELTGLLNRGGFFAAAEAELRAARAAGTDAVVVFADLDGLKRINDDGGHDAGDEAIRSAGLALRRLLGEEAILGRIGGDEFAALVSGDGMVDGAARLAVTGLSVGSTRSAPDDRRSLDHLLAAADEDMYWRKSVGAEVSPHPPRVREPGSRQLQGRPDRRR